MRLEKACLSVPQQYGYNLSSFCLAFNPFLTSNLLWILRHRAQGTGLKGFTQSHSEKLQFVQQNNYNYNNHNNNNNKKLNKKKPLKSEGSFMYTMLTPFEWNNGVFSFLARSQ